MASIEAEWQPRRVTTDPCAADNPLELFDALFAKASAAQAFADAMTLATVTPEGKPTARVLLYKGRDAEGLLFFTNEESPKAADLAAHPDAALVFFWASLGCQVRMEGEVSQAEPAVSDAYFATRPRESQVGAWASPQSQPIPNRETLDTRVAEMERRFAGATVPRPPRWGGYRLRPARVELWFAREGRLHDRYRYERDGAGWRFTRLAP